ncbi:CRISPR-associated helicase Cas3, subtype Dpsyc [Thioflavicoccus mobilis 8321]|uniref:CRISPR-associated helicase Cas3, subtype Dpsyc n=1 Tax=Thioflavicoccus mobilis 8321 TaxID=765912 RepID=L0GXH5_9GAMM|nr:type I-U CRISPR-associated helicase/endonuclease Cas3 [Thioflavicoccus mobilis]AGA90075.1 CRISPR-associated helicase Cas3, subtype Dpsyc [Thioflavicoccus mobilis 8321]
MTERPLTGQDFADFFAALWHQSPFPWQSALAERLLAPDGTVSGDESGWPQAITLPTASGKTACLDIALFALAAQAYRPAQGLTLTAPRRIFFVVDRRVIVDEAYARARMLAARLADPSPGILTEVAERLRGLAAGPANDETPDPLACFQLRGGIFRDDAWARSPTQPTIVCSTVDQIGSRLLFRAYGRSFKAWPLQAGLVGNDSLILLDEAHCAQPFMQTLEAVARYRRWAERPLASPFRLVVMTATPPAEVARFPDPATASANRAHLVLKRRLEASKPCRLEVAARAQGRDPARVNQALAEALVAEAGRLVEDYMSQADAQAPAVCLFCNRVDTARRAHALLARRHAGQAILLTGRMRPFDKNNTLETELAPLAADRAEQRQLAAPLFVVSTQTLEVGANLDFDLMVSECADLSALRQRFGRLNRMGRSIAARGVIVVRANQEKAESAPDPIYDRALQATWAWLAGQRDEAGEVDLGVAAIEARLPADLGPLTRQAVEAPVLLPAHLDALVQTAPVPCPSPDVSLFLHGPQAGPADVQVCWRADLSAEAEDAWIEAVALCPPATGELMPVPLAAIRRWLAGEPEGVDGGDIEGIAPAADDIEGVTERRVLRWRGREDAKVVGNPREIRPGDLLIIPAAAGGWDSLGHVPTGTRRFIDLGDRGHWESRARAILRLTPESLDAWPQELAARARLRELVDEAKTRLEEEPATLAADLKTALVDLSRDAEAASLPWLKDVAAHLASERHLERCIAPHPGRGLVLSSTRRLRNRPNTASIFSAEDDVTASGTVHWPLMDHLAGAAAWARHYTDQLPKKIADDIALAALCHDLGKADPRFQTLLQGGTIWTKPELLAKSASLPHGRQAYEEAREKAGYPKGGRHELLSVRLLESAPNLLAQAHDPELVRHLIESHHGHCRPFAPVVDDPGPDHPISLAFQGHVLAHDGPTGLDRLDSGVAERFWRLTRRYGWWGLAALAAALMLSDHRRSEWEERHASGDPT